ncbi:MAG TPA: DnaJ domain-containing protein [Chloroflexota bacterium]|nr:DnaJ domain-containing protein [Chloroflexota bacterium]
MVPRDYFAILEIGPDASEAEIRGAYRRLARRYHPDLHPERDDAEQRLKELNAAYEVLSDPSRRARYLRERRVRVPVDAPGGGWRASRPPAAGAVVRGAHVDLSGGRTGWRAYGRGSWSGAASHRPRDEEELALLYARRLLRALFGW